MNQIAKKEEELPVVSGATSIIQVIERAALDPNVDIDKMERLLAMKERLDAKDSESVYNQAMTAAQSEMRRVSADATNPQTRSKYASYAAIDKALRPIYTAHGFSLSFDTGESPIDAHIRVVCHISHAAGHTRSSHIDMPADGKGAKGGDVMTKTHAAGAAMSYGMRYLLKMIFNVAIGEDDVDGNETVPRISEEQATEIHAKITENNLDMDKFMSWLRKDLKCGSIEDINLNGYGVVLDRIAFAIKARAKK